MFSKIFITYVKCGVGMAKRAERSGLPWTFFGYFLSFKRKKVTNIFLIIKHLFYAETKKEQHKLKTNHETHNQFQLDKHKKIFYQKTRFTNTPPSPKGVLLRSLKNFITLFRGQG